MKKIILAAFIVMVLVQWLVPGSMIWNRETILRKGKAYKFKTQPVDPSNPFKGRYVALNFEETRLKLKTRYTYGQDIYLKLSTDDSGYAKIRSASPGEPSGSADYLKASVNYVINDNEPDSSMTVLIRLPFTEYYMDEFKAPRAEKLYQEFASDTSSHTYALVRIYKGGSVIQDLIINGRPVGELLQ